MSWYTRYFYLNVKIEQSLSIWLMLVPLNNLSPSRSVWLSWCPALDQWTQSPPVLLASSKWKLLNGECNEGQIRRKLYQIVSCNSTKLHRVRPTVLSTVQPGAKYTSSLFSYILHPQRGKFSPVDMCSVGQTPLDRSHLHQTLQVHQVSPPRVEPRINSDLITATVNVGEEWRDPRCLARISIESLAWAGNVKGIWYSKFDF